MVSQVIYSSGRQLVVCKVRKVGNRWATEWISFPCCPHWAHHLCTFPRSLCSSCTSYLSVPGKYSTCFYPRTFAPAGSSARCPFLTCSPGEFLPAHGHLLWWPSLPTFSSPMVLNSILALPTLYCSYWFTSLLPCYILEWIKNFQFTVLE